MPLNGQVSCGPPSSTYHIMECGVDWLTATCEPSEGQTRFNEKAYSLLHNQHGLGEDMKPWSMSGFEGLRSGGVGFAKREGTSMVRLSGHMAFAHWRKFGELATNVSRIDLQVTIRGVSDPPALVLQHHKEALDHVAQWAKPPTVDLRLSNRSSPTLYLGRRVSDRFGRVYDKGNESGETHYQGCVRYEWQFNGKSGWQMSRTILRSGREPVEVIPFVAGQCLRRGLSPTFTTSAGCLLTSPRKRGTDDDRLEWLARQVAPAVQELISRGKLTSVIMALRLQDYIGSSMDGPIGPTNEKELEE